MSRARKPHPIYLSHLEQWKHLCAVASREKFYELAHQVLRELAHLVVHHHGKKGRHEHRHKLRAHLDALIHADQVHHGAHHHEEKKA